MGEIVNLRRARKDRERRAAEAEAAGNRAVFGLSRVEKITEAERKKRDAQKLDGHRRDEHKPDGA